MNGAVEIGFVTARRSLKVPVRDEASGMSWLRHTTALTWPTSSIPGRKSLASPGLRRADVADYRVQSLESHVIINRRLVIIGSAARSPR